MQFLCKSIIFMCLVFLLFGIGIWKCLAHLNMLFSFVFIICWFSNNVYVCVFIHFIHISGCFLFLSFIFFFFSRIVILLHNKLIILVFQRVGTIFFLSVCCDVAFCLCWIHNFKTNTWNFFTNPRIMLFCSNEYNL